MKYYTQELLDRFGSGDDGIAAVATPWLARLGGQMATMPVTTNFQP